MKKALTFVLCLLFIFSLFTTVSGADICSRYRDIDQAAWYHEGVHFVTQNEIMLGTDSNAFSPHEFTSRAMFVTILYRISGSPSVFGLSGFKDVQRGSYYEIPVIWAGNLRVTRGTNTTSFAPNETISRQDIAVMLMRYAATRGYTCSQSASLSDYTDAGDLANYARRAMEWAVAIGLIRGVSENRLAPREHATRAEIATIIMRMMQYYNATVPTNPSRLNAALQASVQNTVTKANGNYGVYVEELTSGASIYVNKNTGYNTQIVSASIIKLWVMGAVYEQIEAGKIKESNVSAKLNYMVTISDNQSCNDLVKLLGNGNRNLGINAVNAFIQKYGFSETKMTRLMLESTGTQNYTSIRDCANFLRMIYKGELISSKASKSMLELMKKSHRIHCAAGLPASVGFAHKTGALVNLCFGDVGIVFAPQPYILCVINNGTNNGPTALQTISALIYNSLK